MYCLSQQRPSYRKINKRIIAHPVICAVQLLKVVVDLFYITCTLHCLYSLSVFGGRPFFWDFKNRFSAESSLKSVPLYQLDAQRTLSPPR